MAQPTSLATDGPTDAAAWRHETRARLLAARDSLPLHARRKKDDRITASLLACFEPLALSVVGAYTPLHGEFDPLRALEVWHAWGARILLSCGSPSRAPAQTRWRQRIEPVGEVPPGKLPIPDALLVPATGFDEQGYRLGYDYGCSDPMLARHDPRPLTICATYELGRLEAIHPRPEDMPMHFIVTEQGVYEVTERGLRTIPHPIDAAAAAARILTARAKRPVPARAFV